MIAKKAVEKIFGKSLAKMQLTGILELAITEKRYSDAEQILSDNEQRLSKRYKIEWRQQIKIAKEGKINPNHIDGAIAMHSFLTILYFILFVILIIAIAGLVQGKLVLGGIIILGSPVWYFFSSSWISTIYRRKYGFQIYNKNFHHMRFAMTLGLIGADLLAIFN